MAGLSAMSDHYLRAIGHDASDNSMVSDMTQLRSSTGATGQPRGVRALTGATPPHPATLAARLEALDAATRRFAAAAKASNTIRGYRSDLADFETWCEVHHLTALPAEATTVALYLTALAGAGARASTLQRRISAISQAHQLAGLPTPTRDAAVRTTMAEIRRTAGTAPVQKDPVVTAGLRQLLTVIPTDRLDGLRDRALLLLGFAGGFRRSELVALDMADLEETGDGLRVRIRRSGTDRPASGREVGIPFGRHPETCPIRAVRAWRDAAGITTGPLFRAVTRGGRVAGHQLSDRSVARIVQRAAARAGLDPSRYAGHSLRSGLATAAAAGGASERAIMAQTGHRSLPAVPRSSGGGSLFTENAAAYVGL
jgi:site-specific recombinase XerD